MAEATKRPWYLDKRVGCLAIYPLADKEHVHCLDGARDWAIHYAPGRRIFPPPRSIWESIKGYAPWTHWEVDPERVANAELTVRAVNSHDALVNACECALEIPVLGEDDVRAVVGKLEDALGLARS